MLLPHAIAGIVSPTDPPVTLDEVKEHLLVQHEQDDSLLIALIDMATEHAERESGLYLMPRTVEVSFSAPDYGHPLGHHSFGHHPLGHQTNGCHQTHGDRLELPLWPIQAVSAVQYLDANGTTQTWDPSDRQVWLSHRPPLVSPAYGKWWPVLRHGALRAIWFTCGVGFLSADAVPEAAKHAIKLIAGHNYANKGDGRDPTGELGIPPAAKRFLDFLRQDFYR